MIMLLNRVKCNDLAAADHVLRARLGIARDSSVDHHHCLHLFAYIAFFSTIEMMPVAVDP